MVILRIWNGAGASSCGDCALIGDSASPISQRVGYLGYTDIELSGAWVEGTGVTLSLRQRTFAPVRCPRRLPINPYIGVQSKQHDLN